MYPPFESEEQGIIVAQQALDKVRVFLRRRTAVLASAPNDDDFALRFQFEHLEDMLRVISDNRYARGLAGQNVTHRFSGNIEILQFIATMAREMTKPGPSSGRPASNDTKYVGWNQLRVSNQAHFDDLSNFTSIESSRQTKLGRALGEPTFNVRPKSFREASFGTYCDDYHKSESAQERTNFGTEPRTQGIVTPTRKRTERTNSFRASSSTLNDPPTDARSLPKCHPSKHTGKHRGVSPKSLWVEKKYNAGDTRHPVEYLWRAVPRAEEDLDALTAQETWEIETNCAKPFGRAEKYSSPQQSFDTRLVLSAQVGREDDEQYQTATNFNSLELPPSPSVSVRGTGKGKSPSARCSTSSDLRELYGGHTPELAEVPDNLEQAAHAVSPKLTIRHASPGPSDEDDASEAFARNPLVEVGFEVVEAPRNPIADVAEAPSEDPLVNGSPRETREMKIYPSTVSEAVDIPSEGPRLYEAVGEGGEFAEAFESVRGLKIPEVPSDSGDTPTRRYLETLYAEEGTGREADVFGHSSDVEAVIRASPGVELYTELNEGFLMRGGALSGVGMGSPEPKSTTEDVREFPVIVSMWEEPAETPKYQPFGSESPSVSLLEEETWAEVEPEVSNSPQEPGPSEVRGSVVEWISAREEVISEPVFMSEVTPNHSSDEDRPRLRIQLEISIPSPGVVTGSLQWPIMDVAELALPREETTPELEFAFGSPHNAVEIYPREPAYVEEAPEARIGREAFASVEEHEPESPPVAEPAEGVLVREELDQDPEPVLEIFPSPAEVYARDIPNFESHMPSLIEEGQGSISEESDSDERPYPSEPAEAPEATMSDPGRGQRITCSGSSRLASVISRTPFVPPYLFEEEASLSSAPMKSSCTACGDDFTSLEARLQAPCGHLYCRSCAGNLVKAYMQQESLHPLQCCNTSIPLFRVRPLLSSDEYSRFCDKREEYVTPHDRRIYCPKKDCGRFLKLQVRGRQLVVSTAKCPACSSSVCLKCKEFDHPGEECEENKNIILVKELAKEQGWQTCSNCHSIVEKIAGCLHMTCLCGYEFCYRCGEKYTGPGMCGH